MQPNISEIKQNPVHFIAFNNNIYWSDCLSNKANNSIIVYKSEQCNKNNAKSNMF